MVYFPPLTSSSENITEHQFQGKCVAFFYLKLRPGSDAFTPTFNFVLPFSMSYGYCIVHQLMYISSRQRFFICHAQLVGDINAGAS